MNNFDNLKKFLTGKTVTSVVLYNSDAIMPSIKNDTSIVINAEDILISDSIIVTEKNLLGYTNRSLSRINGVTIGIQMNNKPVAIAISVKK